LKPIPLRPIAHLLYLALPVLLLISACKRDTIGDILFEAPYAPFEFGMPAGEPGFRTFVVARPSIATGAGDLLRNAGVAADDVEVFGGLRARVVSLTGEDFSEIERIELRACPVGTPLGCDRATIVFSQSDLFRRRQQSIDLSPGLLNFKELFLGNDNIRIELVLQPGATTTRNIEARLEWAMAAFGEN